MNISNALNNSTTMAESVHTKHQNRFTSYLDSEVKIDENGIHIFDNCAQMVGPM